MNEPAGNDARVQRSKICSTPFMLWLKVYKTTKQTGQGEIQAKMFNVYAIRSSFKILYAILAPRHGKRCHGNFVISHVKL